MPPTEESTASARPVAAQQPPTTDAGSSPAASTGAPVAGIDTPPVPENPGFRQRGRLRRRLRFLRRARELAYRDLGGLVFEMHRLGQRREDLLAGKLATLAHVDTELRAIEAALRERSGPTVLREAGVAACPRCAAIHGSEDRFCPNCGFAMGRQADRPIGAPAPPPPAPAAPQVTGFAPPPTPRAAPPAASASAVPAPAPPSPSGAPPRAPAPSGPSQTSSAPATQPRDEPTEIVEPPTQIVRPASDEPPAGGPKQA